MARALTMAGRDASPKSVKSVLDAMAAAKPERLEAHGVDCSVEQHRQVYEAVFSDAAPTIIDLHAAGVRIGVVSDIHFDLRPVFRKAGLHGFVDDFVLSFELGVQKPDPAIFQFALDRLRAEAASTLMVGDRPSHDGAAAACGVPTLLLTTAPTTADRRLQIVASAALQRNPQPVDAAASRGWQGIG